MIRQGKKPSDEKKVLKFKCKSCKCVFKTDEYQTVKFWVANRGRRRRHQADCPNCGKYVDILIWI